MGWQQKFFSLLRQSHTESVVIEALWSYSSGKSLYLKILFITQMVVHNFHYEVIIRVHY